MKKTKLFTSLAAFVLVLGLGACNNNEQAEAEEKGVEVDCVIVGDFPDNAWDTEPGTDSKYYIPAGTTHYEVSVDIADVSWDAGLRVVEYGTWNLVAGYDELDAASTGVNGEGGDKNILVDTNATYDLVIDFGETNSIKLTQTASAGEKEPTLPVLGEVKEGDYFLGFNMSNTDYYFDGTVYNTNYAGVTDEIGKAVVISVAATESGYSLAFTEEEETVYLNMTESGTYRNLKWGSDVYSWGYDTTYSTFVALDSTGEYQFIGTYGTYKDLTLSAYGYLTGDIETSNAQYPAHLYDVPEDWEPYEESEPTAPTSVTVSAPTTTIYIGESIQLSAEVNEGGIPGVTYSLTSGEGVVSVTSDGLVTVPSTSSGGQAVVRATATTAPENGEAAYGEITLTVTVPQYAESETITASELGYADASDVVDVYGTCVKASFGAGSNTSNAPKYYNLDSSIRVYKNNTVTFASRYSYYGISKIELNCAEPYTNSNTGAVTYYNGAAGMSATNATVTQADDNVTVTITPTIQSSAVVLTNANEANDNVQLRIVSIVVTYTSLAAG